MDIENPLFYEQETNSYEFAEYGPAISMFDSSSLLSRGDSDMMFHEVSTNEGITMEMLQKSNEETVNEVCFFDNESQSENAFMMPQDLYDDIYLDRKSEENENECAMEPFNYELLNTEELFGELTPEERSVVELLKKTNERIQELKKIEKEQENEKNALYEPPFKRVRY